MDETLDITPLERALARLEEGWRRYLQDPEDLQIRDGLIQRFEFTYELAHKMLSAFSGSPLPHRSSTTTCPFRI